MADVPVPRPKLTPQSAREATAVELHVPKAVLDLLDTLWAGGHAAYVVGGSLRDVLLARRPHDWDLTTDALPERIQELFPGSNYENKFGTVAVRRGGDEYEITPFRVDHDYADHRRPHRVEFGGAIEDDLARRDFTVNAMAWGAPAPDDVAAGSRPIRTLVDPFGGTADVDARLLRAVGEPTRRFEEDALRMIRAVRLAATLDFTIEPATLAAIRGSASLAAHLSGERIAIELERLLTAERPSVGLRLMHETGLLAVVAPDLAEQPGVPQNKIAGEDLWDHTLRAVDAAASDRPAVRLAALLHDIGKPQALTEDGHFFDHDRVGAEMAAAFLSRLHVPRSVVDRVHDLVEQHMFSYEANWSDAAVRRFMNRVGISALDELFELREADNAGSGIPRQAGLTELRRRVAEQLEAGVALSLRQLAVNGDDLIRELRLTPGPHVGRILDDLLDAVIADSALNDRPTLLLMAQSMLEDAS
ncbi:MAG: HD domain-containing protein [Mycobacteriales bacterium]